MAADPPSAGNGAPIAHRHLLQHQKDVLVLVQPSCCCGSRAIDDLRSEERYGQQSGSTLPPMPCRRHALPAGRPEAAKVCASPPCVKLYQSTTAPPLSRGALGFARHGVLWSIHLPSTTDLDRLSTPLILELRCSSDMWTFSMAKCKNNRSE